jgi:hypothetical protein
MVHLSARLLPRHWSSCPLRCVWECSRLHEHGTTRVCTAIQRECAARRDPCPVVLLQLQRVSRSDGNHVVLRGCRMCVISHPAFISRGIESRLEWHQYKRQRECGSIPKRPTSFEARAHIGRLSARAPARCLFKTSSPLTHHDRRCKCVPLAQRPATRL